MKVKIFLTALCLASLSISGAYAQKGVDNGTRFGSGEDSIRCLTALSLYATYAKAGNYADAVDHWTTAYNECPAANKDIYLYGVRIVEWEISKATDAAEKEKLVEKLMAVYDQRIKYFGNDTRYGKDWIMGQKANKYLQHYGAKAEPTVLYGWLKPILDEYESKTDPLVINIFMFSSIRMLAKDPENNKTQYIEDYMRCAAYLDSEIVEATAKNDTKTIETLTAYKKAIDEAFAGSGAADCETLESMYTSKVEENKENMEFLQETLALFKKMRCTDTDIYITASRYLHINNPTAESAIGLAKQAVRDNDNDLAVKYFEEAISLEKDPEAIADNNYMIALIMFEQKNYSRARQYANKAIEINSSFGKAYLLIGQMYAITASSIYPNDAVLTKVVYNAALDKIEKARQVDPEVAEQANNLINNYRAYLPSTEDVFMHPDLEKGKAFTVGGWINERTTIR